MRVVPYEAPRLEEAIEAYETPQLLDVEEVVTETSGCYTLGIGSCGGKVVEEVQPG